MDFVTSDETDQVDIAILNGDIPSGKLKVNGAFGIFFRQ